MRTSAHLLAAPLILAMWLAGTPATPAQTQKPVQAPAGQAIPGGAGTAAVHKFSVVSQDWHRFPGLAVADITFQNGNEFRVRDAVISCEFLDPKGKLLASRGSTVFESFPPGKKKIEGIEFSLREKNAVPGTCRVISVSTTAGPN